MAIWAFGIPFRVDGRLVHGPCVRVDGLRRWLIAEHLPVRCGLICESVWYAAVWKVEEASVGDCVGGSGSRRDGSCGRFGWTLVDAVSFPWTIGVLVVIMAPAVAAVATATASVVTTLVVATSAASVVARAASTSAIIAVEWLAALPLVVEGRARLTALVVGG